MNLENYDFGPQSRRDSTCFAHTNSVAAVPKQAQRTLERHEASFALEYLRSACQGIVPSMLRQRVGESDLVQDALLKATQSIGQFRGSTVDSFRCWLREIYQNRLKNLVRAHITSQKRSVRLEKCCVADTAVEDGPNSKQLILDETAAMEMQIMNQAFQQLSAKDQQIVELHSRRGIAFDQAAIMLGVSEVSVRKRYTRAIERWRKMVQEASKNRS